MKESTLNRLIAKLLKDRGAWGFTVRGSVFQLGGLPDRIACYRGRFVAFELKQKGKEPTAIQEKRMADIRAAGGYAAAVWAVEDAAAVLDAIDREEADELQESIDVAIERELHG